MKHLDDGLLHAWLDGEVDEAEDLRVQEHLASCPECAERLDLAARDRAAASELVEQLGPPVRLVETASDSSESLTPGAGVPAPRTSANAWLRPLAWAASMVLAVALGWFARPPGPAFEGPPPAVSESLRAEQPATLERPGRLEEAVALQEPVTLRDAAESEDRQAIAAAPAPEARLQAAPSHESANRGVSAGAARLRAAPPSIEAVSIPASSVSDWLGREPLRPPGADVLAARLLPASALIESIGDAPVVELDLRLSDGGLLRLWQQRLTPGIAAAADARMGRAAVVIDGLLVVAEGEAAAETLASLSAFESR